MTRRQRSAILGALLAMVTVTAGKCQEQPPVQGPGGSDVRPVIGGIQGRAGNAPPPRTGQVRPPEKAPRPFTGGGPGGGNSN